jgi:hypothetical protein
MLKSIPVIVSAILIAGCTQEPNVSFKADIQSVLDRNCSSCHSGNGDGVKASGFVVDTHADVMRGTKFGPVVVAGHAESSSLYRLVAGKVDRTIRMPHGEEKLPDADVAAIKKWIDQGAKDN